jgi:hypothetical protein
LILRTNSNPALINSTVTGRSLLQWYFSYEDYWCLLGPFPCMLPLKWRQENMQQQLIQYERRTVRDQDRPEQSWDYIYAKFNLLTAQCIDLTHRTKRLKFATDAITQLIIENNLKDFEQKVLAFLDSSQVKEALKYPLINSLRPLATSPDLPFQSAEAGLLLIICFSYLCFIHLNLYTTIYFHRGYRLEKAFSTAADYAQKICQAVWALDQLCGNNHDEMIPCSEAIYLAALFIPNHKHLTLKLHGLKKSGCIPRGNVWNGLHPERILWSDPLPVRSHSI